MSNNPRNGTTSKWEQVPVSEQVTVHPRRLQPPLPTAGRDQSILNGGEALNWSTRTLFINGHDGGGAALLRVMTDGYQRANGLPTSTAVIDLGSDGIDYPIDTTVRVLCVKADATGAKVAMRALSGESRLVVVAAQLDGIFHPKVPYAARYTFRQLDVVCPVRFMPYEIGWRSDLAARPGRRYQRAVARMVTVIEQTRNNAGGVNPQPVSKSRRARK